MGDLQLPATALRDKPVPAADCPKCARKEAVRAVPELPARWSFGGVADYTFGVCGECGEICGLTVALASMEGDLSTAAYEFPRPAISVSTGALQEPTLSADEIAVPPYMPERVTELFRQARHSLTLGNWDAAGMTYRKALEIALRDEFGFGARVGLAGMIDRLSSARPAVFELFAEWLRKEGNRAAHEADFTEPGVLVMDGHIEQLFVHLFVVREIRRRLEDG